MRLIVPTLLLLIPAATNAGWFSYDDYDDCMLGRMKGQDGSMYSTADKACKRQFKMEFPLYVKDIKWNFEHGIGETIVTIEDADEYEALHRGGPF
jgi:hypothetical protein